MYLIEKGNCPMHPYITQNLVQQHRADMLRSAEDWRAARASTRVRRSPRTWMLWRFRGALNRPMGWPPQIKLPPTAVAGG
jgi:hypothetical protein